MVEIILEFETLFSLGLYFMAMLDIGLYSYCKSTSDVSSVVIVLFFTLYTSSVIVAGSKLFESSFGLNYEVGLYVTAGVVVAYTLFGGFLAVSLTDFVQGCIMFVALVAIYLAYDRNSSILSLVSNAWAGFGAAFGPVVIGSLYWKKMTRNGALAGMVTGAVTVLLWIYLPITINGHSLSSVMYEIVPGFILCSLVIFVVSNIALQDDAEILAKHDEMLSHHA